MKKYIIGGIIGALIMISGQVAAEELSKIGRSVQGEAIVKKDGKELSSAVIIDGKSYAPVRDISESVGLDVSFDNNKVNGKSVINLDTPTAPVVDDQDHLDRLNALISKKERLEKDLALANQSIENMQKMIDDAKEEISKINQEWAHAPYLNTISTYEALIPEKEKEVAELQAQIEQVNADIAALESSK